MSNDNELVWVIPRDIWRDVSNSQGFVFDKYLDIYNTCINYGGFRYRSQVENDENFKQVIPQALFKSGNKIFVTQRLKKQTEKRLVNCYSLAIGGHINPEDSLSTGTDIVQLGLFREMGEEVYLPNDIKPTYIGVTNSDNEDVSRVHLGLWFLVELPEGIDLEIKEKEKMTGSFLSLEEIEEKGIIFESWSEMIFKDYILKSI